MAAGAGKYEILYSAKAAESLKKMDKSISEKIKKKIDALAVRAPTRALKKHPDVLVLEFGQYRALYLMDAGKKTKTVFFVGDHKEYEKRYGKMF
ncbi:MAG: type II toxin-antitoxin system RelE/ParE family toxin [Candidatus Micrarchaeota archaeon]|nr:type II toxin-antitoxin system RelE/ParE family toxin [Candidatus Micrarchaeota archaeon]